MSRDLLIDRRAQKQLTTIQGPDRGGIIAAVRELAEQPEPEGVKKLTGREAWESGSGITESSMKSMMKSLWSSSWQLVIGAIFTPAGTPEITSGPTGQRNHALAFAWKSPRAAGQPAVGTKRMNRG